ncbi:hypothetical protein UMZ34_12585 [Halopseudomonas pachastrellae]|nr:hypothetical protein UMZ34_12585 [Halopseudomonas pachastrellae]
MQGGGQAAVDVEQHLQIFLALITGQYDGQVAQQRFQFKVMVVQFQLARFDLGVVEDVVEQAEQRVGRAEGLEYVVELARVQAVL